MQELIKTILEAGNSGPTISPEKITQLPEEKYLLIDQHNNDKSVSNSEIRSNTLRQQTPQPLLNDEDIDRIDLVFFSGPEADDLPGAESQNNKKMLTSVSESVNF